MRHSRDHLACYAMSDSVSFLDLQEGMPIIMTFATSSNESFFNSLDAIVKIKLGER